MTPRRHSQLARDLIKACGGVSESAKACRLGTSQLSNAQNANQDAILPLDVVIDLEKYCGRPIYSSAMVDACGDLSADGDLIGDAIDLNAKAAAFLSRIHYALSDAVISPRECDMICQMAESVRQSLMSVDAEMGHTTLAGKTLAGKALVGKTGGNS